MGERSGGLSVGVSAVVLGLWLSGCGVVPAHPTGTGESAGSGGSGGDTGGTGGTGGSGGEQTGTGASAGGPAELPKGPSCADLPATCGPSHDMSCCAAYAVEGGEFLRGYDGGQFKDANYPATVSSFGLDAFEVTVGRFRKFVEAGYGVQTHPPVAGSGANPHTPNSGWYDGDDYQLESSTDQLIYEVGEGCYKGNYSKAPGDHENYPISCVTWWEAFAFCTWDGGRLPTEAEWSYAASGGKEQRTYPWSSPAGDATITAENAVFGCNGMQNGDCHNLEVGTRPKGVGRYGQYDLSGNVEEWVLDFLNDYGPHYPHYDPVACTDCACLNPDWTSGERVSRGGFAAIDATGVLSAIRSGRPPTFRSTAGGFRCARDL